jgi:hypothetical protein
MQEIKYKIVSHLFSLKNAGTFQKELNIISWNDRDPVYDLRGWNDDHTKMTKGITLNKDEFKELKTKLLEV